MENRAKKTLMQKLPPENSRPALPKLKLCIRERLKCLLRRGGLQGLQPAKAPKVGGLLPRLSRRRRRGPGARQGRFYRNSQAGDLCLRARAAALWRIPAGPLQKLCVGHRRRGPWRAHRHAATARAQIYRTPNGRAHIHTLTLTLTHTRAGRDRQPVLPRPPRSRAEFPPLLIVRGPAPAQPPPRPTPPPLWASSWGRGRRPARTGRGGSRRSSARWAAAAQTPPGPQPPSLLAVGSAPQPSSAAGRRGRRSATPEFAAVARPPPSGADAPAAQTSDPAPEPQPPAPSPRARITMGPALALSPLLLLLLLPPPSLSNKTTPVPTTTPTTKSTAATASQSKQDSSTAPASTASAKPVTGGPGTTTLSSTQTTTSPSPEAPVPGSSPTTTTMQNTTTGQRGGSGTTEAASSGPQQNKTDTVTPPGSSARPGSSAPLGSTGPPGSAGGRSGGNATTVPPESDQLTTAASSPTPVPLTTSELPPASTTASTASPGQPVATPAQITDSHSTRFPSSPSPVASSDFPVTPGRPTTHAPLDSSKETPPPITSQRPGTSTLPLSTPRQPTGSPGGTAIVPATEEFTRSSSNLTPTAPQGPSTPSPTWTFRDYKLKCDSPVSPDEGLLVLNVTGASLCEGSPPDEKLVELLCRSVKASFKPAQDQCTLQVAPIINNQGVAVKKVIIETKLSPKDVFELLKDKWDDLREAGVSHMMLGKEGPPEANEDRFSLPLIITIVCMASFLLLVAALYGCCHQRISQRKDQQRLTEELQTVENGYHDNPTLEVMETPSEMQEKKVVNLNGELGDSWIVPLDNLTKDDLDEEEDTHL
ncbi:LOW QUALITY PROTEIN: podocalyxin [Peromyscus leucopus]|uniref:LOW QUALITY PROTEIN: podocalyxin n=1 Tax=Peromyscus leucopus TaxID=10041 RepID=UPI001884B93C|nr:LOW QUALITY PROTEIN: podocalyxin [Peromyscus leucopus]